MSVRFASRTTIGALAERFGGDAHASAAAVVSSIAAVEVARAGELAPLVSRKRSFVEAAMTTEAVVLVDQRFASLIPEARRWSHPRAEATLFAILEELAPAPSPDRRGAAFVDPEAHVDAMAIVGPGAVILAGARVGAGARVEPNAVIYGGSVIGARVVIGAGAVVGRPGFGWSIDPSTGSAKRIPQLGGVVIEDDAEVGPLATIDAGTLGPTFIGRGAKLDAHVHVGHNARIGALSVVAAQAGFAGSADVGRGVLVGGQAGVGDHLTIGDGARLAGKAGVIGDVPAGAVVAGYPAVPRADWLRTTALTLRASREGRTRRPTKGGKST